MSLEVIETTADVFQVPIASLFINHEIKNAEKETVPILRNEELRRLRQQLGVEVQKVINTSIEELMQEDDY